MYGTVVRVCVLHALNFSDRFLLNLCFAISAALGWLDKPLDLPVFTPTAALELQERQAFS